MITLLKTCVKHYAIVDYHHIEIFLCNSEKVHLKWHSLILLTLFAKERSGSNNVKNHLVKWKNEWNTKVRIRKAIKGLTLPD